MPQIPWKIVELQNVNFLEINSDIIIIIEAIYHLFGIGVVVLLSHSILTDAMFYLTPQFNTSSLYYIQHLLVLSFSLVP